MLLFTLFAWLYLSAGVSGEQCRNYSAVHIRPWLLRTGVWFDRLHVHRKDVSTDTASLFMTNFPTHCGYYELKGKTSDSFELYKGYHFERFAEHFYPSMTRVTKEGEILRSSMHLEKKLCDEYKHIKSVAGRVNILATDHTDFMILHQCIDGTNNIMLLTQTPPPPRNENEIGIRQIIEEIMTQYEIQIDNQIFVWPTTAACQRHMEEIYPQFYRKKYIDRVPVECSPNVTVGLAELEDYYRESVEAEESARRERKYALRCFWALAAVLLLIVALVSLIDGNFEVNWRERVEQVLDNM